MGKDIRDNLAEAINDFGFKKTVLAEKSGLTPMQLCDILNKRRKLEANEMFSLCEAMNLTSEELRGYKSERSTDEPKAG